MKPQVRRESSISDAGFVREAQFFSFLSEETSCSSLEMNTLVERVFRVAKIRKEGVK